MTPARSIVATVVVSMLAGPAPSRRRTSCAGQAGFPERPIRIVVPVAPGGGVDTFARLIANKVKIQRDVNFIVENRTERRNSTIGGIGGAARGA